MDFFVGMEPELLICVRAFMNSASVENDTVSSPDACNPIL